MPTDDGSVDRLLALAEAAGALKRVPRTGWVMRAVPAPESVAEHSFRVALLATMVGTRPGIDGARLLKMALIHDLAEARLGDVVTASGARTLPNEPAVTSAEQAEMRRLAALCGDAELAVLFDEFVEQRTPEAKLLKELDKLELAIQAAEYERDGQSGLDEFFESARSRIHDPELTAALDAIVARRGPPTGGATSSPR